MAPVEIDSDPLSLEADDPDLKAIDPEESRIESREKTSTDPVSAPLIRERSPPSASADNSMDPSSPDINKLAPLSPPALIDTEPLAAVFVPSPAERRRDPPFLPRPMPP